jgi:hypothetical protein
MEKGAAELVGVVPDLPGRDRISIVAATHLGR